MCIFVGITITREFSKGAQARAHDPSNPDPKANVRWGDQTWEEMQYAGITFVVDEKK